MTLQTIVIMSLLKTLLVLVLIGRVGKSVLLKSKSSEQIRSSRIRIGSPAMNFINVKNWKVDTSLPMDWVKVQEGALVLKEKGYDGKELIFGIRQKDVNTEANS